MDLLYTALRNAGSENILTTKFQNHPNNPKGDESVAFASLGKRTQIMPVEDCLTIIAMQTY